MQTDWVQLFEEQCSFLLGEMPVRNVTPLSTKLGTNPPVKPEKPHRDSPSYQKVDYADQMLIRNVNWRNKVKLNVAPNVPFNFDIILDDNASETIEIKPDPARVIQYVLANVKPTPGVITCVFGSTGDPLSPWIVSHKIGHAIFDTLNSDLNRVPQVKSHLQEIRNLISLMIRRINDMPDYSERLEKGPKLAAIESYAVNTAAHLIHQSPAARFKSAVDKNIQSMSEYVYELAAMYLQKGKITFDPILDSNGEPVKGHDGVIKLDQRKAQVFAERIEENIVKALTANVGKVIADY
jgi:hypothetical protein